MNDAVDTLDVVALTGDVLERGLYRGQVGTVVESRRGLWCDLHEIVLADVFKGVMESQLLVSADVEVVLAAAAVRVCGSS